MIIKKEFPFHIFVTGGEGVGKSYLIEVLVEWLILLTAPASAVQPVHVCAPTGVAAYNVKGKTIHSLFYLPVRHKSCALQYHELSGKTISEARKRFQHIHTVIIDEISMVGADSLEFIHKRLTVLKQNDAAFGGINIIAVGDFFQLRPTHETILFKPEYATNHRSAIYSAVE